MGINDMLAQKQPNAQRFPKPSGHYKPVKSKEELDNDIRKAIREAMKSAIRKNKP